MTRGASTTLCEDVILLDTLIISFHVANLAVGWGLGTAGSGLSLNGASVVPLAPHLHCIVVPYQGKTNALELSHLVDRMVLRSVIAQ